MSLPYFVEFLEFNPAMAITQAGETRLLQKNGMTTLNARLKRRGKNTPPTARFPFTSLLPRSLSPSLPFSRSPVFLTRFFPENMKGKEETPTRTKVKWKFQEAFEGVLKEDNFEEWMDERKAKTSAL